MGGIEIMSKVAVLLATGFEEIEALTTVDVLRRAKHDVDIVGLEKQVTGGHDITVVADQVLDGPLVGYDLIALPGGKEGAENLRDNDAVIESLQKQMDAEKQIGAICAAPIVLEKAGAVDGKQFTSFPGFEEQVESGHYQNEVLVVDGKLVTSRGPATALEFAYQLVEQLGGDSSELKEAMQYNKLTEYLQK